MTMYNNSGQSKINGIPVGEFKTLNKKDILDEINKFSPTILSENLKTRPIKITLTNIKGDRRVIHESRNTSNATIQVASQFNCLEMAYPENTPFDGITIYKDERTQ